MNKLKNFILKANGADMYKEYEVTVNWFNIIIRLPLTFLFLIPCGFIIFLISILNTFLNYLYDETLIFMDNNFPPTNYKKLK